METIFLGNCMRRAKVLVFFTSFENVFFTAQRFLFPRISLSSKRAYDWYGLVSLDLFSHRSTAFTANFPNTLLLRLPFLHVWVVLIRCRCLIRVNIERIGATIAAQSNFFDHCQTTLSKNGIHRRPLHCFRKPCILRCFFSSVSRR